MRPNTLLTALLTISAGAYFISNVTEDSILHALKHGGGLDDVMEATSSGKPDGISANAAIHLIDLTQPATPESFSGLKSLAKGDLISVQISAHDVARYVVDLRHESDDTTEIRGHLLSDETKLIVLGIKDNGATGFFELPDGRIHALSYAEGVQFAGQADKDWMRDKLAPQGMVERAPGKHEQPPLPGAMPVHVDLPILSAMTPGQEIAMQFPGIGVARVAMDRLDINPESTTWVGHLADFGDSYPVLVTYSADAIEGSALTPQGEVVLTNGYTYNPQLLGMVNAKIDGENCVMGIAAGSLNKTPAAAATSTTQGTTATASSGTTAGNTLDVLVYYSPDMEVLYGSASAVTARVDALFAAANQAYNAANLGYNLRRVGLKKLNTSDTTSNDTALTNLQKGLGEFAGVAAERNSAGADLVTVIRPLRTAQHVSCGVAYVGGYGSSDINAYINHMVSVVSDGSDRNGTNTYCDTMTLAHETGHNLGLMHDRATVTSQGGGSGVKPYAFGYSFSKTWGTIMSYTSPVQYRFSDPDDTTCPGGQSCGIVATAANSADNVLALSHSLPLVAAFRASTQSPTASTLYTVSGIATLDGAAVAGVNLTPSISSASCTSSGSTGMYSCQAPAGSSFTLTPNLQLSNGGKVTWTPANASFSAIAANATANFTGKRDAVNYTVSGKITLDGVAVSGATLKVTGTGASCGATNSTGSYTCNVASGSSISLAPNVTPKTGTTITWTPTSLAYTGVKANVSTANFTGKSVTTTPITVSGKIVLDARAVSGATLTVTGSGASCGATSSAGTFSCTVTAGASFTLSPNVTPKPGATISWTPTTLTYNKVSASIRTANFTGKTILPTRTINGTVTVVTNGLSKPVAGVTIKPSLTGVTCGKTTSAGSFSCSTTQTAAFSLQPSLVKTGYIFRWMSASVPASASGTVNFIGSVTCPKTGCVF